MKLHLFKDLLLRTPQFSTNSSLHDNWGSLKVSIKESSAEFFEQIEQLSARDLDALYPQLKSTIWKYFNRSTYRATPYGSFASVGIAKIGDNADKLIIASQQQVYSFPDWTCKDQINFPFEELVKRDTKLFTNSSFYKVGDQYRFIAFYEGQYELVDIELTICQRSILNQCLQPSSISRLLTSDVCQSTNDQRLRNIEFLLDSQLLFSETQPNIIGEDYFRRINYDYDVDHGKKYQIAERNTIDGSLPKDLFKHLPALVEKLHRIIPTYQSPHLKNFIAAFLAKYEYREIPLMIALDPELGIGYGAMTQEVFHDEIIEKLQPLVKDKTDKPYFERITGILAAQLLGEVKEIDLEQLNVTKLENPGRLPNTLPVLCTTDGKLVQVETIGSCSATSLCGRFSHLSDAIHDHCRELAKIEQQANPDVIFFDIGYSVGNVVDNINRRKQIYDYQLSILNYDTSENPLTINDLVITVADNQLILRSRRLNKRLIPRLASAYNYTKSDLPLFRILCDLQQQSLSSNLGMILRKIIPGLKRYPRVFFKNLIVSPATWKLMLSDIKNGDQAALKSWCAEHDLPRHIRAGFADQTLCFDLQQDDHLGQLLALIKKQKMVELEECLVTGENIAIVRSGNPYAAQFTLAMYHEEEIYKGYHSGNFNIDEYNGRPKNAPGSKWLYFELYCNPLRANELLSNTLSVFLNLNEQYIHKWFFVRYKEQRDHLRLRIQVKETSAIGIIIENLYMHLAHQIADGTLSDLSIRTYEQEQERYGADQMPLIESHFACDSRFVLSVLKAQLSFDQLYQLCLDSALIIGESGVFTPEQFTSVIQRGQKGFALEHDFKPPAFKILNAAFQKHIRSDIQIPAEILIVQQQFLQSFIQTLKIYESQDRNKIFSSLLHMHINRIFPSGQRTYEAMIYYFIDKALLRSQKLSTHNRAT